MSYLSFQEVADRPGQINNVFYSSYNMIENFYNYRDLVFVNRRLTKTRFNKTLIMFCGINNHGRNIIFASCFLHIEDEDSYRFMLENFDKALG